MYHQVEMSPEDMNRYSDLRGEYSIVNRRFTEITNGYQNYTAAQAAANTVVRWTTSQPQGCVTELMIVAYADAGEELVEDEIIGSNILRPNLIRVIADSITQKELDGKHKIELELYSHGFVAPADFPSPDGATLVLDGDNLPDAGRWEPELHDDIARHRHVVTSCVHVR